MTERTTYSVTEAAEARRRPAPAQDDLGLA
jgi:hypothetical protein